MMIIEIVLMGWTGLMLTIVLACEIVKWLR